MGRGPERFREDWDDNGYAKRYSRAAREREYEPEPRRRPRRPRRKKRTWPILLLGCGLGMILTVMLVVGFAFYILHSIPGTTPMALGGLGSKKAFTQENTQQIPLSSLSTLAQMQICNKIGDVTITVDPAATATTVATKKIVHAENQQMADQELKNIVVQVQPPGSITNTLTCAKPRALGSTAPGALAANGLIVNVTLPDNNGGLIHNSSNAVNIAITLPEKVLSANGPSLLLDVEAPVGNISVNGLSGVLTIQGSSGNVTVKHAILAAGSHIETGQGNVTFDGLLAAPTPPDAPARYILQSEEGKIDVTLPESTNVILDANTNVGTINSDFPLYNVENNKGDGPVNFRGPLNSTTSPQSKAVLMLDVSTGSIALHKAQV